jgi:hypothetical protein
VFDILLVDQDLWKASKQELGESRCEEIMRQTRVLALAPLGISRASRNYRDLGFHDWMARPVRIAKLADALTTAGQSRDLLAAS